MGKNLIWSTWAEAGGRGIQGLLKRAPDLSVAAKADQRKAILLRESWSWESCYPFIPQQHIGCREREPVWPELWNASLQEQRPLTSSPSLECEWTPSPRSLSSLVSSYLLLSSIVFTAFLHLLSDVFFTLRIAITDCYFILLQPHEQMTFFFKLTNHLQYICHFIMNIHHLNWPRNTKPSGDGRGITLQVNGKTWVMQTIITVIYFSLLKNTWHQDCIIEINQLQSKTHFQIFVCFWFITQHPNNIISICFIILVL